MTTTLIQDGITGKRYRIVGDPENKKWTVRAGQDPWCELTITEERYASGLPTGTLLVTTFGGEVWPNAWPSLFANCGRHRIEVTAAGRALLSL